jgi:signal-transduction protein with cAMP-binding, CBS, and nucleotidyltransferase domain
MYSSRQLPAEFERYDLESKEILTHIVRSIQPKRTNLKVTATSSWYADPSRKGNLYLLKEGMLTYRRDGKTLFSFNEGDLVGVENFFCVSNAELETDFAVVVDEFHAESFFAALHKVPELLNLWNNYLAKQFSLFSIMLANSVSQEEAYTPDVCFYMPGEKIFEQGETGHELYTIIEGEAAIVQDGVSCGVVRSDDFCGVLSGLSGEPRPCSVVAITECIAVRINKSSFGVAISSRSAAVQRMLERLGELLLSGNPNAVQGLS